MNIPRKILLLGIFMSIVLCGCYPEVKQLKNTKLENGETFGEIVSSNPMFSKIRYKRLEKGTVELTFRSNVMKGNGIEEDIIKSKKWNPPLFNKRKEIENWIEILLNEYSDVVRIYSVTEAIETPSGREVFPSMVLPVDYNYTISDDNLEKVKEVISNSGLNFLLDSNIVNYEPTAKIGKIDGLYISCSIREVDFNNIPIINAELLEAKKKRIEALAEAKRKRLEAERKRIEAEKEAERKRIEEEKQNLNAELEKYIQKDFQESDIYDFILVYKSFEKGEYGVSKSKTKLLDDKILKIFSCVDAPEESPVLVKFTTKLRENAIISFNKKWLPLLNVCYASRTYIYDLSKLGENEIKEFMNRKSIVLLGSILKNDLNEKKSSNTFVLLDNILKIDLNKRRFSNTLVGEINKISETYLNAADNKAEILLLGVKSGLYYEYLFKLSEPALLKILNQELLEALLESKHINVLIKIFSINKEFLSDSQRTLLENNNEIAVNCGVASVILDQNGNISDENLVENLANISLDSKVVYAIAKKDTKQLNKDQKKVVVAVVNNYYTHLYDRGIGLLDNTYNSNFSKIHINHSKKHTGMQARLAQELAKMDKNAFTDFITPLNLEEIRMLYKYLKKRYDYREHIEDFDWKESQLKKREFELQK